MNKVDLEVQNRINGKFLDRIHELEDRIKKLEKTPTVFDCFMIEKQQESKLVLVAIGALYAIGLWQLYLGNGSTGFLFAIAALSFGLGSEIYLIKKAIQGAR